MRPLPPRRIAHVDIDAFLASVEVARARHLRGRPVIVGGLPHERNLVMSCSYEARARGVRPGMGLWEAAARCPDGAFLKGSAEAATAARERVRAILERWTPLVEVASIDDFFADLTGTERLHGSALRAAEGMARAIRAETSLSVTIGIGGERTSAKVAGDLAKPGGIAEVFPGAERAFLAPLPVRDLPGVGPAVGRFLDRANLRTIGELAAAGEALLEATFGAHGRTLWRRARGEDPAPVEAGRRPREIARETTFERETADREEIEGMLFYLAERAAARLRALGCSARIVAAKVRFAGGTEEEREAALPAPTDGTAAIAGAALALARRPLRRSVLVRLVGVSLSGLAPRGPLTFDLFDEGGRAFRLDRAVDRVRARHGFGALLRGPSIGLLGRCPRGQGGFVLRTPSLAQ
ncbi:MAG TPA: DNA polymerase IV [Planctomycetota bacterium]|jgi:DNA polymerase-4|nr:DNA polymerase IV [Planctomycetota bacterium]